MISPHISCCKVRRTQSPQHHRVFILERIVQMGNPHDPARGHATITSIDLQSMCWAKHKKRKSKLGRNKGVGMQKRMQRTRMSACFRQMHCGAQPIRGIQTTSTPTRNGPFHVISTSKLQTVYSWRSMLQVQSPSTPLQLVCSRNQEMLTHIIISYNHQLHPHVANV